MIDDFQHRTAGEKENVLNLVEFLRELSLKQFEEGKLCNTKLAVLLAERYSEQDGQKKTNRTSYAMNAEFKSSSGTKKE